MTSKDPTALIWWLVSRASGIVALGLITFAVLVGLTMSSRIMRKPGVGKTLMRLHEHVALVSLGAISLHGLSLIGDPWLNPGLKGVTVPFTMGYRPLFTGLGILSGYLAALLGLSFYMRRKIGVKLWRKLHRATILVWVLGVVHTLGAGSDAATVWLRAFVLLPSIPIAYLFVMRIFGGRRPAAVKRSRPASAEQGLPAPSGQAEPARKPARARLARESA